MSRVKVLVIDDDAEYLEETGNMLTGAGYDVELLADSTKSMPAIKKMQPDVVLLDLNMDGKDGFQVAKEISEDPETRGMNVIAITGYYSEKDHQKLMRNYGLKGCILKPVNPLEVIRRIEDVMDERRNQTEKTDAGN